MSRISGSGGASGMGASSSSSDASAMAQSTGSSGAGSRSMCLEKSSSWAWSAAASATASLKWASLGARNGRHPVVQALFSSQKSVTARAAHSVEDWRRHVFFMAKPSKVPSRTERARGALACVWTQLKKLRKTATSQGCKYEVVRVGKRPSWRPGWPRWRGCWPCPREGSTLVLLCLGSSRRPGWLRAAGAWSSWPSRSPM